jgi:hypothetical protein
MKRRAPKNIMPVIAGLLIIIVGSMMWNIQESFSNRRRIREGVTGSKTTEQNNQNCTSDNDCATGTKCVDTVCK